MTLLPRWAPSSQFAELPTGQEEEAGGSRGPTPGVRAEVTPPEAGSRRGLQRGQ